MKRFIKKTILFMLPFIMILSWAFISDPFKAYFYHEDFYDSTVVVINREMVCLKLFLRNNERLDYDAFIMGNSRSLAFRATDWQTYLPEDASAFHFDASGEGLYGIYHKLKYLEKNGNELNDVLIVLDKDTMEMTHYRNYHIYMTPPAISDKSPVIYYLRYIKANVSLGFLVQYIDYSLFKTSRPYMDKLLSSMDQYYTCNNDTADLTYAYEAMIKADEVGFYAERVASNKFPERPKERTAKDEQITQQQKDLLVGIKGIFKNNNTNYRIVVSPMYNQIPFAPNHLTMIEDVFGKENVFDYSGENTFTASIKNYYEFSHYRPNVAMAIMEEIYGK